MKKKISERSTDENMELAITIHTMLAQEEIRNMSETFSGDLNEDLNRV